MAGKHNNLPPDLAAERFVARRQEKKRKRQLKSRSRQQQKQKEQRPAQRYLFRQWLRQQFRKKAIPWDYFRRYGINSQCYLWLIEELAGILCGNPPGRLQYNRRNHEKIFAYLIGIWYLPQYLPIPEIPFHPVEISEALKNEIGWMEKQDMRQIIAIALWEAYQDLDKLPWSEKASRRIPFRIGKLLKQSMAEIVRARIYQKKYNLEQTQGYGWSQFIEMEDMVLSLASLNRKLSRKWKDIAWKIAKGTYYSGTLSTWDWTLKGLYAILGIKEARKVKKKAPYSQPIDTNRLLQTRPLLKEE